MDLRSTMQNGLRPLETWSRNGGNVFQVASGETWSPAPGRHRVSEQRQAVKSGLTPVAQKFILHWGEMGTKWGINRTVAQVHALLFLSPGPVPADEIATT